MQIYYKVGHCLYLFLALLLQWYNFYRHNSISKVHPQNIENQIFETPNIPLKTVITIPGNKLSRAQSISSKKSQQSNEDTPNKNTIPTHKRTLQKKTTMQLQIVRELEDEDQSNQIRASNHNLENNQMKTVKNNRTLRKTNTLLVLGSSRMTNSSVPSQVSTKRQSSFMDIPDSHRVHTQSDLIPLPLQNKPKIQYNLYTFQLISRLIVLQGLLGWFLFLNIDSALAGFIDFGIVFILRFLQNDRKLDMISESFLSTAFTISSLIYLEIDFVWTITYIILVGIQVILDITNIVIQRKSKSINKLILALKQ